MTDHSSASSPVAAGGTFRSIGVQGKADAAPPDGQQHQEVQPKPEPQPRVAQPDALIPKYWGAPRAKYFFNRKVRRRPDLVPPLSAREQLDRDIADLETKIRALAPFVQATACFLNVKGGASKTTTAVHVGSILAELTRYNTTIMPATQSTATSTLAENAGIKPEDTLTAKQFRDLYEQLGTLRELSKRVPRTQFGLCIISEDTDDEAASSREFTREDFLNIARTLFGSNHFLLFDSGNDETKPSNIPYAAVVESDVAVITATAGRLTTLNRLRATISPYLTFEETAGKVRNSIVVISGHKEDKPKRQRRRKNEQMLDPVQEYEQYIAATRDARADGSPGFDGEVFIIPFDSYLENHVVVDIKRIRKLTYLAYLKLTYAILKQAQEHQQEFRRAIDVVANVEEVLPPSTRPLQVVEPLHEELPGGFT